MYNDELMRYTNGTARVRRSDREVATWAKGIRDEVRLAAFKVDGTIALAAHLMEGVLELDARRRALATDQITAQLLGEIEAQAIFSVKKVQANLFNDWRL